MANKNAKFINPYNFFPLNNAKTTSDKNAVIENNEKLSGVINYTIKTRTPLFIPNTSNEKAFDFEDDQYEGYVEWKQNPASENKKKFEENKAEHKSYDFYSYTDLANENGETFNKKYQIPVIPGSEIRGMLRSNFEMLTDSCMAAIEREKNLNLGKRVNHVFEAGLLKREVVNGEAAYRLYKAEDCLWRNEGMNNPENPSNVKVEEKQNNGKTVYSTSWTFDKNFYLRECYKQNDFAEGVKVYFTKKIRNKIKSLAFDVSKEERKNCDIGYVIKGEDGPSMNNKQQKHCAHIFANMNQIIKDDIDITILDRVIKAYQSNGDDKTYGEYKKEFERFKKGNGEEYFPVYFSEIKDKEKSIILLSCACFTREMATNKFGKYVGKYKTCDSKESICPACSLFGIINEENGLVKSSRIRFTDAKLHDNVETLETVFDPVVTLKELAGPKINNMEFYYERPAEDAVFWTYDYYITLNGSTPVIHHLGNLKLNGRKFYWHNMIDTYQSKEKANKRNVTIRPVKKGISFEGKVYFDGITKQELDKLLWTLECGEQSNNGADKKHGYKLGKGKPLGLGSVEICVTSVEQRGLGLNSETKMVEYKNKAYSYVCEEAEKNFDASIVENYKKMTSFDLLKGENINYPFVNENEEVFKWFVNNHYAEQNKKGVVSETKSPNNRSQMRYRQFMVAMEPELQNIKEQTEQANADVQTTNQNERISSQSGNNLKMPVGTVLDAEVTGMKGNFAYFKCKDGNTGSAYNKNGQYKAGQSCKVVYKGKNRKNPNFDYWEFAD